MKRRSSTIILLIMFSCAAVRAQKKPSAELARLQKVMAMKDDTAKINAFTTHMMTVNFFETSDSNFHNAATKAFGIMTSLAENLNYLKGSAKIDYIAGYYSGAKNNLVRMIDLEESSLRKARKIGDRKLQARALDGLTDVYSGIEDYDKALKYRKESLKIYTALKDKINICYTSYQIATIYNELKKTDTALVYDRKAEVLANELNDDSLKAGIYADLAWDFYILKDYVLGWKYCKMQARYAVPAAYRAPTLNTLMRIYLEAPDSALVKMGVKPNQRQDIAFQTAQLELKFAVKDNILFNRVTAYQDISKLYAKRKNFKDAYLTYLQHTLYKDSADLKEQQKLVMQRSFKEDITKQANSLNYQQRLTNIKNKQQRNFLSIGLGSLFSLSVLIFFLQRRSARAITKEKQRSDDLLNNILPADVAEELKQKGSASARLFDNVTVLFTDFVNFTIISEMLSPQELVDELHHCFMAFDEIMAKHQIEKIKTIGDAYLAVAGLPNADVNHAAHTINAALEIHQFITNRKRQLGSKTFDIRIGIHSGSVVAGIVGIKKFAYDIWGDTVNTAARMEQNSKPGKINVSESTYELVKSQFGFSYRGEIEAKNKGALKMYFLNTNRLD